MGRLTSPTSRLGPLAPIFLATALAGCAAPAAEPSPIGGTMIPSPPNLVAETPAIGTQPPGTALPGATAPAVGGAGWQALTDFPASGAFAVTSVASTGGGFVAVGFGPMPGEGYFGRHQGFVWRSADGRTWTAETDPTFQFVTPEKVEVIGDSVYVFGTISMCDALFADDCVEPPESGWAVWRSSAGASWERLPQLPQMQFGNVDGVVVADNSLVAFGTTGDEALAIVWTSSDGTTWTATTDVGEIRQISAAIRGPAGVIVFGVSDALGDPRPAAAMSADGVNFTPVDLPRMVGSTVHSLAAGAGGLVAVGDREEEDLELSTVALQSADGATWTETNAADGSFANSAGSFVHPVANGYVAVGMVPSEGEFGSFSGTSWQSADGRQWRTLASFGDNFTGLDASAAAGPGIVAFTVTSEELDEVNVTSTIGAWLLSE